MKDTIMYKEIMEQPDKIRDCYNYNATMIDLIAGKIKDFSPQNIVIVGRGTSTHAGIFARYLFELYYHIPVSIASQSVFTIYDSYTDLSNSLVIGISQSGSGQDTLEVLKKAKKSEALVISIVNNLDSDIAKIADYVLYCNAGEAKALPATKTFTTTLFLLIKLLSILTHENDLKASEEEIAKAITNGFEYDKVLDEQVEKFVSYEDFFVLGRGLTLPLAMETSLKIEETSRIHVSSYPIAEFYHGPLAMANKQIPIIIFDLDDATYNDVIKIYNKVKENNVPTMVITNRIDMRDKYDNCILIEANNEIESFFTAITVIQLFACKLAVAKGQDPDSSSLLQNIKTF